ncbi:MAG: glycosyltransferase family 2 protein [Acidobacteria bacterium]|nr:glycosyltransferase family 2 protein [Acidobacteriota bacterium]
MKITVAMITRNEEDRIVDALASVPWADEIVIVDAQSTDRTVEVARRFTDRIFVRSWPGYAAQKNFADDQASHEWVFSLDADERVSSELSESILDRKSKEPDCDGYRVARRAWYLGRWIRHSGWYPDYQLRLYRRSNARWRGDYVHESVWLQGRLGQLDGDLLHFTRRNLAEHHTVLGKYTSLAADSDLALGRRVTLLQLLFRPPLTFLKSYLLRLGFLDGTAGFMIAGFAAYYVFLRLAKSWEKEHFPHGWGKPGD